MNGYAIMHDVSGSPNFIAALHETPNAGRRVHVPEKELQTKAPTNKQDSGHWQDKRGTSSSNESEESPRLSRRKETARRQLLGSIYTKHKTVGRSFSFVAGEKPPVHIRFPRVCYKDDKEKDGKDKVIKDGAAVNRISSKPSVPHGKRRHSKISESAISSGLSESKPVHRTNSQKISLPDIIMDFNQEINMAVNDKHHDVVSLDSDSERNERLIGASYEQYLKPKLSASNPCKAKYRPVTPGLLDSLNKLKLPSKVKTEQWLRNSQNVQKSYCVGSYKVGNLHNSNLTYPNWIYTDS